MSQRSGLRHLYVYVLMAIVLGGWIGYAFPVVGLSLKPLGEGFIKLIKMVVAPIIFTTVVVGMASTGNLKRVGRIGLKAVVYFEVMTTLALIIGWVVAKTIEPGAGVNADVASLAAESGASLTKPGKPQPSTTDFLMDIIPSSAVGAFTQSNILQVLLFSVLFGFALSAMGERNKRMVSALDLIAQAMMKMVAMIVRLAPIAAFGTTAYTIAKFGPSSLVALGKLIACVFGTCAAFVILVLGLILKLNGISVWKFLRYIREELLIVLSAASSEPALPRLMVKLEQLGCSKSVVALVLPAGYSLNLDGSSIFLTMGALYVAQATNIHLTFQQELTVFMVCLLTSKGAAGVVGTTFVALTATLASLGTIPVEGMALILGIDPLLAIARAMTNLIGNSVATIFIARNEKEFDDRRAAEVLNGPMGEEEGED